MFCWVAILSSKDCNLSFSRRYHFNVYSVLILRGGRMPGVTETVTVRAWVKKTGRGLQNLKPLPVFSDDGASYQEAWHQKMELGGLLANLAR